MSKELTEQWRNETLEEGWYYVLYVDGSDSDCDYWNGFEWHFDYPPVKEVLAPVPTYAEFKDLMSNLQYIDKCRELTKKVDQFSQLVKKVEELEKQLKEANEVIESLRTYDFTVNDENAEHYQVKWNVEAKRFYKNRK